MNGERSLTGVADFDRFIFVVGAPRSGTTTLSQFLKDHPAVAFAHIKEPHFFSRNDLRVLGEQELRSTVERDYLAPFFSPDAERRVGAEGSVSYLYRPEWLGPVLQLWPQSRFIVALRNPLEMLPSLHRRLIYNGDESVPTFEEAWRAVPDRAAGRRIPRSCAEPNFLRYDEAGRLGTYLKRLFDTVGRERCLPVIFDDLSAHPGLEYRRMLDFCGLQFVPRTEYGARRKGSAVRLRWLQRLLKRPPKLVRDYVVGDHSPLREKRRPARGARKILLGARERLLEWNRTSAPPEHLGAAITDELRGHLDGEVDQLGRLLGRDLSHWLRPDV